MTVPSSEFPNPLRKAETSLIAGFAIRNLSPQPSLVVQWLRLCTSNAGGPGSIPGQGTRSYMLQLRPGAPK